MEVIGKTTCQPVGDCGSGKWGNIKTTSSTIHIDQSYKGGGSDGTISKPYVTIGAAVLASKSGAHIAVAEGVYKEDISVSWDMTIEGRCAKLVKISGTGNKEATFQVIGDTTLKSMTITGKKSCLAIAMSTSTVQHVIVEGCETGPAVQFLENSVVKMMDSLVAANNTQGFTIEKSTVTFDRTVIRDTLPRPSDNRYGAGLAIGTDTQKGPSTVTFRDCVVAGNRGSGIDLYSSKVYLERTVVANTQPQASDKTHGIGIVAATASSMTTGSELVIKDSLVSGNRNVGISVFSSKVSLDRSVVCDTKELAYNNTTGFGIYLGVDSRLKLPSNLTLKNSALKNNTTFGLYASGSIATIENSVISDTRPQPYDSRFGGGIEAVYSKHNSKGSTISLKESLVASNYDTGVGLWGSSGTLEKSIIRDTKPKASDKTLGWGVAAATDISRTFSSNITMKDMLVSRNHMLGVQVWRSTASIKNTLVTGTKPQASDGNFGYGVLVQDSPTKNKIQGATIQDSVAGNNVIAGIVIADSTATIERCNARNSKSNKNGAGGDGIVSSGSKGSTMIVDTLVEKNERAGLFSHKSKVSLQRSLIRDNLTCIAHEKPEPLLSKPTCVGNKNNTSTSAGYKVILVPKM